MSSVAHAAIHTSQFPENVRRDLLESLHTRQVNHKFHYDSVKQTQKWLALHQACSPSRNDADCAANYDRSFVAALSRIGSSNIHLIGLGCGGGQKDTRLLGLLQQSGKRVAYTPSDVSVAMVLVARQTALSVIAEGDCHPFVCDLETAEDLPEKLDSQIDPAATRLITFFGMIPNFEPDQILPKLASLVRPADWLLFSANLAPGADYATGIQHILPQYDNVTTRDWLMTFLLDLGVERIDGEMRFAVEDGQRGLKRVAAYFYFSRAREIRVNNERFVFSDGDAIRLFFSYRYTTEHVRSLISKQGLEVLCQWITQSEEEGIYLCQRT